MVQILVRTNDDDRLRYISEARLEVNRSQSRPRMEREEYVVGLGGGRGRDQGQLRTMTLNHGKYSKFIEGPSLEDRREINKMKKQMIECASYGRRMWVSSDITLAKFTLHNHSHISQTSQAASL